MFKIVDFPCYRPTRRELCMKMSKEPKQSRGGSDKNKSFDKKTFRFKKYSHKYKVDKWEDKRKKQVLKTYYKDLKNDADYGKYKPFDFDKYARNSSDEDDISKEKAVDVPDSLNQPTVNYVMHPRLLENFKKHNKVSDAHTSDSKKIQPFWKVKQEMQRIKEEKMKRKQEYLESKKQREEALEKYKKKKADKFKKLSKKNRRGQPVMKDRMNLLLEKIQKTVQ